MGGLWRAERRSQETVSAMVQFARESDEWGHTMSSFTVWCPALLSLGQPLAKAGSMERLMRLMVANGTDERVLALRTEVTTLATVKLAGEE